MPEINVVAIIQARMGSSRLPGKVLRCLAGKPMLQWVTGRVSLARRINQVVVATTDQQDDDLIADFCNAHAIAVFRGNQFDVLDRYYQAAVQFKADVVVRVTADCPVIDPEEIDTLLEEFTHRKVDFAANRLPPPWHRTYPIGLDTEVVTMKALTRAWKEASAKHEREHVMPYFYSEPGRFKMYYANMEPDYGTYRWTVDTPEDLSALEVIFSAIPDLNHFGWKDVLQIVQTHPEINDINQSVMHKVFNETDSRMVDLGSKDAHV